MSDADEARSDDAAAIVEAIGQLTFMVEQHADALGRIADAIEQGNRVTAEATEAAAALARELAEALRDSTRDE